MSEIVQIVAHYLVQYKLANSVKRTKMQKIACQILESKGKDELEISANGFKMKKLADLSTLGDSLVSLSISCHALVNMEGIAYVPKLAYLNAGRNSLKNLGDICCLGKLVHLDVSGNFIHRIPVEIRHLEQLESINFCGNAIHILTDVGRMGTLKKLSSCNLTVNPVADVAHYVEYTISHLVRLQRLDGRAISTERRNAIEAIQYRRNDQVHMQEEFLQRQGEKLLSDTQNAALVEENEILQQQLLVKSSLLATQSKEWAATNAKYVQLQQDRKQQLLSDRVLLKTPKDSIRDLDMASMMELQDRTKDKINRLQREYDHLMHEMKDTCQMQQHSKIHSPKVGEIISPTKDNSQGQGARKLCHQLEIAKSRLAEISQRCILEHDKMQHLVSKGDRLLEEKEGTTQLLEQNNVTASTLRKLNLEMFLRKNEIRQLTYELELLPSSARGHKRQSSWTEYDAKLHLRELFLQIQVPHTPRKKAQYRRGKNLTIDIEPNACHAVAIKTDRTLGTLLDLLSTTSLALERANDEAIILSREIVAIKISERFKNASTPHLNAKAGIPRKTPFQIAAAFMKESPQKKQMTTEFNCSIEKAMNSFQLPTTPMSPCKTPRYKPKFQHISGYKSEQDSSDPIQKKLNAALAKLEARRLEEVRNPSLCDNQGAYQNPFHLEVHVTSGKIGLSSLDLIENSCSTFITLRALQSNRRDTSVGDAKATTIKYSTTAPSWKESFTFKQLASEDTDLLISMVNVNKHCKHVVLGEQRINLHDYFGKRGVIRWFTLTNVQRRGRCFKDEYACDVRVRISFGYNEKARILQHIDSLIVDYYNHHQMLPDEFELSRSFPATNTASTAITEPKPNSTTKKVESLPSSKATISTSNPQSGLKSTANFDIDSPHHPCYKSLAVHYRRPSCPTYSRTTTLPSKFSIFKRANYKLGMSLLLHNTITWH